MKVDEVITNKKDVDEENEFDEEYKVEEDLEDVPESLKIRIKLKCWAEDFKVARNKFKPTFKNGATFTIYWVEIKVLNDLYNKPIGLEVKTKS